MDGSDSSNKSPSRLDLLELDIDLRLAAIWEELEFKGFSAPELEVVAVFMRAAYGKGYHDALSEPRGQLHRDHGYRLPETAKDGARDQA